jgi:hypothetical protein
MRAISERGETFLSGIICVSLFWVILSGDIEVGRARREEKAIEPSVLIVISYQIPEAPHER